MASHYQGLVCLYPAGEKREYSEWKLNLLSKLQAQGFTWEQIQAGEAKEATRKIIENGGSYAAFEAKYKREHPRSHVPPAIDCCANCHCCRDRQQ